MRELIDTLISFYVFLSALFVYEYKISWAVFLMKSWWVINIFHKHEAFFQVTYYVVLILIKLNLCEALIKTYWANPESMHLMISLDIKQIKVFTDSHHVVCIAAC